MNDRRGNVAYYPQINLGNYWKELVYLGMVDKSIIDFKVGETYHALVGGTMHVYKIYIVSIIDEGHGMRIVYKYFGKHKQWWHYSIESPLMLDLYVKQAEKRKIESQ